MRVEQTLPIAAAGEVDNVQHRNETLQGPTDIGQAESRKGRPGYYAIGVLVVVCFGTIITVLVKGR